VAMLEEKNNEESFPKHLSPLEFQPLREEDRRILFNVFFNKEKAPYLDYLKRTIPIFSNLHRSFWENPHFLRWQLIRLNTEYQTDVEEIWRKRWTRAGMAERQEIEQYFFDFKDCFPRKIDTYETWEFSGWIADKEGKTYFGVKVFELMEKWDFDFPPIPWVFRFIPTGYLQQMATVQDGPGSPIKNWARNLLVYEFSQLEMKDMEIGRLLFGIGKLTKYRSSKGKRRGKVLIDTKHPILVKIDKIKKSMKTRICNSSPF
jgi:hypothetical protein